MMHASIVPAGSVAEYQRTLCAATIIKALAHVVMRQTRRPDGIENTERRALASSLIP